MLLNSTSNKIKKTQNKEHKKITHIHKQMISTNLAGLQLPTCIYNASGARCTTMDELETLAKSPYTGAVLTKSCTVKARKGNPEPRYFEDEFGGSLNSNGLCNLGYQTYASKTFPVNKPYIVSVAGPSLNETLTIVRHFEAEETGCDALELNMSCPNLCGSKGGGSGQLAYDRRNFREYLRRIREAYTGNYGVKLPPYWFKQQFDEVSMIINEFKPNFVTCCNSLPNCLMIENDSTAIKPRGGLGGLGGPYLKPVALANIKQFRSRLNQTIALVGAGGVSTGQDAYEYILTGADAVQVGTALMKHGPNIFKTICTELCELMRKQDYKTLSDFRGNLCEK